MNKKYLCVSGMIATLASCSMDPVYVEQDFGNSVRQMVEGQISDPEVASNPSATAADLLDGASAEESVTGYRKDAKRADNTQREIRLSID